MTESNPPLCERIEVDFRLLCSKPDCGCSPNFTKSVHDRRGSIKGQYQIFLFKVYLVSNTEIRPVGEFIVQKYSRRWLSSFVFIFGLAITPLYSRHLSYRLSAQTYHWCFYWCKIVKILSQNLYVKCCLGIKFPLFRVLLLNYSISFIKKQYWFSVSLKTLKSNFLYVFRYAGRCLALNGVATYA